MAAVDVGATTVVDGASSRADVDENVGKSFPTLLTLRVIMHGREAGSIIGKRGENVKKFREETGARINISDATSPERIVTVTGSLDQIVNTFRLVCCRFEEDLQQLNAALGGSEMSKHLVGLRLILPAIQCGSVIGRSGAKVKEIRDSSGASVQISGDLLPNSTERLVTVSGSVDAVIKAVEMICAVILECPIKGPVSQYRPKPTRPVSLLLPMQYENTSHAGQFQLPAMSYPQVFNSLSYPTLIASQQTIVALPYSALPPGTLLHPLPTSCSFPQVNGGAPTLTSAVSQSAQPTQILTIPNELIGCIIGRGGAKINEIRQQSGANIKISSSDDRTSERVIAITGAQEAVVSAIQLIEHSLEVHKATMYGSNLRHSRSSSSLGLFQQNCTQPSAVAEAAKSAEVAEAVMSSPPPSLSLKQQESSAKQPHQLQRSHNHGGGDLSRPPTSTTLFQTNQGFCVNFQPNPQTVFHQNLTSTPSYVFPLSHVQPIIHPMKGPTANSIEGTQTEQFQANQPAFQTGTILTAAGSHPGQHHLFNPNLYHVQTSAAIQIAFRPLNPLLTEPQLLEASNGNFMVLEAPSGTTTASPDGSNCLIDPTPMLGLKSKGTGGCGGYVLTTGSRSGFKFSPY